MNGTKENDIQFLVQQISGRGLSVKEKREKYYKLADIVQNYESFDGIEWLKILTDICFPIFTKPDKNNFRPAICKVITAFGVPLFRTDDFERFIEELRFVFDRIQKKFEDEKCDVIICVSRIHEIVKEKEVDLNEDQEENILLSLNFIVEKMENASTLVYEQCCKAFVNVSCLFPKVFDVDFEVNIETMCTSCPEYGTSNFDVLIGLLHGFEEFLLNHKGFVKNINNFLLPESLDYCRKNPRDLAGKLKILMVLIKVSNYKELLEPLAEKFNHYWPEEMPKHCSIYFGELLADFLEVSKGDKKAMEVAVKILEDFLNDLELSKKFVKEKSESVKVLSELSKKLPAQSEIKDKMIEMVFDEQVGIFTRHPVNISLLNCGARVCHDISSLISALLTPTSLVHLQKTYSAIRKNMMESVEVLRNDEDLSVDLIRWYESKLIVLFSSLQSISCAKSSLIVMMGIRPSIFEFFITELSLTESWFALKHPMVYQMFVHLLVGHLRAHDFYISQSDYLVPENNMAIGQTKRDYARKQVIAFGKILAFDGNKMHRKIRQNIAEVVLSFIETAISMNIGTDAFGAKEWKYLRNVLNKQSMLGWNMKEINKAVALLSTVIGTDYLEMENDRYIIEQIKKAPRKEAAMIWQAGDSKIYMRQSVSGRYQMSMEGQQKNIPNCTFGAEEFTIVTNFLLKSIVPTTFRKGAFVWMDEMLTSLSEGCSGIGEKKEIEISDEFYEKWRWLLSQTAGFIVLNKMKTPIGKPMETLNAFSTEMNRLAKEVLQNGKIAKGKSSKGSEEENRNSKYPTEWLRVRLLLEFVDILDKLMTNAMNGGASFNVLEVTNLSRTFFTTNAQSCNEWLHRTYYSSLVTAFFNGYYPLTIRFGWNALMGYQKRARDEKSVGMAVSIGCWMTRAMCALSAPKAIIGVRNWIKEEFGTDMGRDIMEALELMAESRYETALVMFESILVSESNLSETLKLIIYNSMIDILNRLRMPQAVSYYRNVLFTEEESVSEDFKSVELLTKFEKVDNREKRSIIDWNIRQKSMTIESAFSQTMRKQEIYDLHSHIAALGSTLLSADTSCRLYSDISSTNLIVSHLVDKMDNVKTKNDLTTRKLFEHNDWLDQGEKLSMCRKVIHWARHLKHIRGNSVEANVEIVRLARKTENTQFAFLHLSSAMKGEAPTPWMRLEIARQTLKLVKTDAFEIQVGEMNQVFGILADVFMSTIQLKQGLTIEGPHKEQLIENGAIEEVRNREEIMSRACIQLAEYIETSSEHESILSPEFSATMIFAELHKRAGMLGSGYKAFIGALYSMSTEMYPELSKAHLKFAQWAYELAKVENIMTNNSFQYMNFSTNDKMNKKLWKCLDSSTFAQLEKEVEKVGLNNGDKQTLLTRSSYYDIWEMVKEQRTKYLSIAASSYFAFLYNMSGAFPYSKKEETTVATLRILDMLVRNGDILIDAIENGLMATNVHIWKEILPQLFARLSHPSEHIRNTLVELISRIGTAAPHAVVFQVVSGAASSQVSAELEENENEERQIATDDDRNKVRDCCEELERRLALSYPNLVKDVKMFILELERINLLNEEKWAVVLGTMEHEMEKRLNVLKAENAKTLSAVHINLIQKEAIIEEKTKLMTTQIFDVLDELYERTCTREAQTENEKLFQATYKDQLAKAFVDSKLNRTSPEKSWAPFKNLISLMVHRNIKKGMQAFEIQNISPYLAKLSDSCVPMPGQDSVEFDRLVSIAKVAKQVTVLPTKTRPKKLGFIGSDGKQCTFLFKGREDLHLDERVMQFLRLCNVMLTNGKSQRSISEYQAHNYAVIPLGPRSGLIKWVEGATPLFHIYRKWQVRERNIRQASKKAGETVPEIERPSEMFNRQIRQAFAAHNLDSSIAADRTRWPTNILKEVHEALCEKTPKDLLSREFWVRSGCATTWWKVTRRYAKSCAVMSMVGSVLGLGDRHLDNLLVDLTKGHVVHIDYNICFDKGKNLRIPETVPFRLTQNMVNALGPGQIEGTFKESCRHVLDTLRNGKQVLTMLLDAFVFDPLVDWTNHEHLTTAGGISLALQLAVYGGEWKSKAKEHEKEVLELFRLRMDEIAGLWMRNRDDLYESITAVSNALRQQNNLQTTNEVVNCQRVEAGRRLLSSVTRHHGMMKDLRPLIRTLSREHSNFAEYYKDYKQCFSNPLLKAHASLSDENNIDLETCIKQFSVVLTNLDAVFDGLSKLTAKNMNGYHQKTKIVAPPGLENVWVIEEEQMENVMARNIVKNVERRLDGYLTTESKDAVGAALQADSLISDAISVTNLSMMYEGWTAWV